MRRGLSRTFYHPDYHRRLWALTRILHRRLSGMNFQPVIGASARGLVGLGFLQKPRRITAGGDFHPAPKIHISWIAPRGLYSDDGGSLQYPPTAVGVSLEETGL